MIIANMATFPARVDILSTCLERLLPQVDKINICLNNYMEIPGFLTHPKIRAFIPQQDYRDVGKFIATDFRPNDDIFYVDDDIIYPADYVDRLMAARESYRGVSPIVGLHGVIYPDVYDGNVDSRVVFAFRKALGSTRVVNQLGTGTVHCKGYQAAPLNFMIGSGRYVDVRYALFSKINNWPLVCIDRPNDWLGEVVQEVSLFASFTKAWPASVIKECQKISGYSKLSMSHVMKIEGVG